MFDKLNKKVSRITFAIDKEPLADNVINMPKGTESIMELYLHNSRRNLELRRKINYLLSDSEPKAPMIPLSMGGELRPMMCSPDFDIGKAPRLPESMRRKDKVILSDVV